MMSEANSDFMVVIRQECGVDFEYPHSLLTASVRAKFHEMAKNILGLAVRRGLAAPDARGGYIWPEVTAEDMKYLARRWIQDNMAGKAKKRLQAEGTATALDASESTADSTGTVVLVRKDDDYPAVPTTPLSSMSLSTVSPTMAMTPTHHQQAVTNSVPTSPTTTTPSTLKGYIDSMLSPTKHRADTATMSGNTADPGDVASMPRRQHRPPPLTSPSTAIASPSALTNALPLTPTPSRSALTFPESRSRGGSGRPTSTSSPPLGVDEEEEEEEAKFEDGSDTGGANLAQVVSWPTRRVLFPDSERHERLHKKGTLPTGSNSTNSGGFSPGPSRAFERRVDMNQNDSPRLDAGSGHRQTLVLVPGPPHREQQCAVDSRPDPPKVPGAETEPATAKSGNTQLSSGRAQKRSAMPAKGTPPCEPQPAPKSDDSSPQLSPQVSPQAEVASPSVHSWMDEVMAHNPWANTTSTTGPAGGPIGSPGVTPAQHFPPAVPEPSTYASVTTPVPLPPAPNRPTPTSELPQILRKAEEVEQYAFEALRKVQEGPGNIDAQTVLSRLAILNSAKAVVRGLREELEIETGGGEGEAERD